MSKTFYITTPIYYPSGRPHIGTAYTTILADAIARYKRLNDFDVRFLTGIDEHGQKIAQVAEAAGVTPQSHVDLAAHEFQALWKTLDISNDDFMRTTSGYHKKAVQKIFETLEEQGDIYLSTYAGYYCTGCETYYKEEELLENNKKCQFGHEVKLLDEECYFLKFDKYIEQLVTYYEEQEHFILPPFRKTEMLENFIKPGLQDLAISRTTFTWGIPVPTNDKHVIYVWLDALTNYITNLGFMSDNDDLFQKYWENGDEIVQVVGKDITRFHTIYWPVMLKALGIRQPSHILAHGFILTEGQKMSKSLGNVIDPYMLIDRYGVDATRYYLLREMPFGQDGSFSKLGFIQKINAEVVNDYANLVNRTLAMIQKYFDGSICQHSELNTSVDNNFFAEQSEKMKEITSAYDVFNISKALELVNYFVARINKYIDETAPWILAKDSENHKYLENVMYNLTLYIAQATTMLSPVMPGLANKALKQFNLSLQSWKIKLGSTVKITNKIEPLFARLDEKNEMKFLDDQIRDIEHTKSMDTEKIVTVDHFKENSICVGQIKSVSLHPSADRLLVFEVDFGDYNRQIVSGVANSYSDVQLLIGTHVLALTNIKKTKLRGVVSEGMILTTNIDGKPFIVQVDNALKIGSKLE